MMSKKAVATLNRAFAADPAAVHALLCNRVPCNLALADDPTIICGDEAVVPGFTLGAIGLINGVLADLGLPLVASQWSDEADEQGRRKLVGFQSYEPPGKPSATFGDGAAGGIG